MTTKHLGPLRPWLITVLLLFLCDLSIARCLGGGSGGSVPGQDRGDLEKSKEREDPPPPPPPG